MSQKKNDNEQQTNTLVVGLGASAGGLQALKTFFGSLPKQTGMAFIVVLHLAPKKESNLTGILERETALKVLQVSEQTTIEADHVYIIPPDKMLSVEDDHLVLSEPKKKHGLDTINLLFRTLAEKKGKYAAGIIFSGSGSDGTTGLKAIKEYEGFALVQDPDEAGNAGMPHSAIKTGVMDRVLPVREMVKELMEYRKTFDEIQLPENFDDSSGDKLQDVLADIFDEIRSSNGHDFGNYRRSSVLRRIGRRMRVNQVQTIQQYREYLQKDPDEIEELYKDLLISVTNFFRDPETFRALKEQVIPKLFEHKSRNDQVRVWVPGCATGEEAYSVAMLLLEHSEKTDTYPEIQVFASDVDEDALKTAREGRYPESIKEDVNENRLKRFFKKDGHEFKVKKELQDVILFASHDLLRNAPFSNQDMIACRNLLIYLNRELQLEVYNLLYYSLRPGGWLFLGRSDSHLGTEGLFKEIDRKNHIYQQKPSSRTQTKLPDLPLLYKSPYTPRHEETPTQRRQNIQKMHWRILSRLFAPQSVLIDEDYNVIHATDGINEYLEYTGGEPSRKILEMAKPRVRQSLRGLLFKLQKSESSDGQQKMHVSLEDKNLQIIARNVNDKAHGEKLIHVVFKERSKSKVARKKMREEEISGREAELIESLEKELEYTKEQLQISIEQYETSYEELRTSNEELQSMNEELQSTTEELETSKEELQSVNEELKTVNEKLEDKVDELSRANNDLQNLMEATEVGIIFVDLDIQIQRFTESATRIFNLVRSDEGRPLHHITHSLEYEHLMEDIAQVKVNFESIKKIVSTAEDQYYIMRLRPYRSTENEVEGIVLTFTEITDLRKYESQLEKEQQQQSSLAALGVYALSEEDPDAIVHRAIQQSCSILKLDCAVIYRLKEENDTLKIAHEAGCTGDQRTVENDPKWDVGYALTSNKAVVVTDYNEEKRFEICPALAANAFVSSLHVVIKQGDHTYGAIGIYSDEKREFTESDIDFVQILANIIGAALERRKARNALYDSNQQLENEVAKSSQYQKQILNNSLIEQWKLGGYLHDNLGQLLASAKLKVDEIAQQLSAESIDEVTDKIKQVNHIIDQGIDGIRDLTQGIIPVDIQEEGVHHALQLLKRRTEKMYDIHCVVKTGPVLNEIKDHRAATHLYYVIQECIKNAAIHGQAKNITISIRKQDGNLLLEIEDDGSGFSAADEETADGQGVYIMQHRVEILEGTFDIPARDEGGAYVRCVIPIENVQADRPEPDLQI